MYIYICILLFFWKGSKIFGWDEPILKLSSAKSRIQGSSGWQASLFWMACWSLQNNLSIRGSRNVWRSHNVGKWSYRRVDPWSFETHRPIVIVLTFAEVDVIYSILWLWPQLKNDMKRPDHFTSSEKTEPHQLRQQAIYDCIIYYIFTLHYILHTLHNTYIYIYIHRKRDLSQPGLIGRWLYTKLLSSADQGDLQGFKYVVPAGQAKFFLLEKGGGVGWMPFGLCWQGGILWGKLGDVSWWFHSFVLKID